MIPPDGYPSVVTLRRAHLKHVIEIVDTTRIVVAPVGRLGRPTVEIALRVDSSHNMPETHAGLIAPVGRHGRPPVEDCAA